MSPSWRERMRIVLAPGGLELTRVRRGLRPRTAHAAALPVPPATTSATTPTTATPTPTSWDGALAALDAVLTEPRWRKADAEVLLSGHFVRVHLLPWSASLATDAERLAYARAELEAVHGERVRDWTLVLDDAPVGQAAPVCAIDTALLDALRVKCAVAALKLRSVRPQFAVALEQHRAPLRVRNGGFAFAEAGRLTLALYQAGACRWLANPRVGVALAEALAAEVRQAEALGAVAGNGRLHVAFAGAREALPARIGGWEVVPLPSAPGPLRRAVLDARLATEP